MDQIQLSLDSGVINLCNWKHFLSKNSNINGCMPFHHSRALKDIGSVPLPAQWLLQLSLYWKQFWEA